MKCDLFDHTLCMRVREQQPRHHAIRHLHVCPDFLKKEKGISIDGWSGPLTHCRDVGAGGGNHNSVGVCCVLTKNSLASMASSRGENERGREDLRYASNTLLPAGISHR